MKKLKQHRSLKPKSNKKYQTGGFIADQGAGLGQAGSSIVDMIDPQGEFGQRSTGGAIASGALKGAGMGAALGPIGAGVGAVIGAGISLIGNKKAKEEAEKAKAAQLEQEAMVARQKSATIMANYATQGTGIREFQGGGRLDSPGMQTDGGNLQAISPDAVQVQGDNPNATDDVQVGDAFVDHNEVITPTPEGDALRIFSDTLKFPGTKKTFSKLAKGLEKQKTEQTERFPEQNNLVEKKLNALFQVQQMMNGNNQGESRTEAIVPGGETPGSGFSDAGDGNMFQTGGELRDFSVQPLTRMEWKTGVGNTRDWTKHPLTAEEIKGWTSEVKNMQKVKADKLFPSADTSNAMKNAVKTKKIPGLNDFYAGLKGSKTFQGGGRLSNFDWESAGRTASAVIPGLVNLGTANRLPMPGRPVMDSAIQLEKVDFGDVQNEHNRNLALELKMADRASSNPNMSPALRALAFGRRGENLNKLFGETSRINTQIGNAQAQINQNVQAGNNMKIQGFRDSMAARRANQLGLRSQATANIFGNLNTLSTERNQMKLDDRKTAMQEAFFETVMPGFFNRHKEMLIDKNMRGPVETETEEPSWGRGSDLFTNNKKGGKVLLKNYRLGGSLKKRTHNV